MSTSSNKVKQQAERKNGVAATISNNEKNIHDTWADSADTLPIVGAREFYARPAATQSKPLTPTEEYQATKATAVDLRKQGASHRQIADALGIERSRVQRLLTAETPQRRLDLKAIHEATEAAPCVHCGGHEPKFIRNGFPIRSCEGCYRKKVSDAAKQREQKAARAVGEVKVPADTDRLTAAIDLLRSVTLGQIARESSEMQMAVAALLLAADRRESDRQ